MSWRKVHVEGEEWKYRIGTGHVVIVPPNGKKQVVSDSVLTGRPPDVIERGKWKKTSDGMILPSQVKAWIKLERRLLCV